MKFQLKDKTAIISGGASGIGRAISLTLAEAGARILILDLKDAEFPEDLNITQINCDITDHVAVRKIVDELNRFIDILVNNAGIGFVGNIENTTEADLDRLYQVNIKGVYNCSHVVMPYMKEKGGVIVNMASIAGTVGINDRFAYSMTKGAVLAMTYSIAKDYLSAGIRCNSISPARIHTPFVDQFIKKNYPGQEEEIFTKLSKTQPIGRMGTPTEVANLALYLCSDEAAFITGTDFPIDGGFIKLNGD
jgi:NAD(P)-dependent dehydrogenase (short-subunit alcohol dehydrogenase family)